MSDDEFEKADADAGVEVLPATRKSKALAVSPSSDIMTYRESLVQQYHAGAPSLVERLRKAGKEDMESLLFSLIDEVVRETDHLLGNELVATQNGELRDASVISFKRAEVLEKAIKAVQARQMFEKESGIDVDSPSVMIIFRFFMSKAKETFDAMGTGREVSDLFFRTMGDVTANWQKELMERFTELKQR